MKKLIVHWDCVPWEDFTSVGKHHDEPLPEQRPLLIKDDFEYNDFDSWFLHWDGAVTMCVEVDRHLREFSKCERDDFYSLPPVLQSKQRVHKDLAEVCQKFAILNSYFTEICRN